MTETRGESPVGGTRSFFQPFGFLKTPRKAFLRNVLNLGGGTALGQFLVAIATPLITRLYSPHDMGLLGIFMAYVGFVGVGTVLRYEMPIVSVREDREAVGLLASSLLLAVPMSLFAGLVFYAMIRGNLLSYGVLPDWSAAAAAGLLALTGVFTSLRYWLVRQGKYDVLGMALVNQGAGRAAVPILLALAPLGWIGLLIGEMTGRALGIGRMLRKAWPAIRDSVRTNPPDYFSGILRRNWKSPAILLPSSLADAMAVAIPLPILSYLFGAEAAGQFFLVQRLSNLPAGLIATSVADVFHPAIADAHWKDPGHVKTLLKKVTGRLALTSTVIYLPFALVSPFVFGFVFGDEWHAAGLCVAVLSPLSMVSLVVSPVSRLLLVVDKMEVKFAFDVISLLLPNLGIFGMSYLGYGFLACLGVYTAFSVGAYILYFGLIWRESSALAAQHRGA